MIRGEILKQRTELFHLFESDMYLNFMIYFKFGGWTGSYVTFRYQAEYVTLQYRVKGLNDQKFPHDLIL